MRLYVLVSFWLGAIVFLIRVIAAGFCQWPRKTEPKSLGVHVADTLLGFAWVIWAAIVLWVKN